MGDVFTDGHKAKARAEERVKQKADWEKMVDNATTRGKAATAPKPQDKPYPMPKPFWSTYG